MEDASHSPLTNATVSLSNMPPSPSQAWTSLLGGWEASTVRYRPPSECGLAGSRPPHAESLRSAMINRPLRIHCDRQAQLQPNFIRTFSTPSNNSSTPLRQASTRCFFDIVKNIFHQNTRRSASGHGNRVTFSAQSATCGSLARQCSVLAGMLDLVYSR